MNYGNTCNYSRVYITNKLSFYSNMLHNRVSNPNHKCNRTAKMSTAKDQLINDFKHLERLYKYKAQIKCARIIWNHKGTEKVIELRIGYSEKEYKQFLKDLEFEFDDSFTQTTGRMNGTIFLKDGAWLDRREYDGSTEWEFNKLPEIPESLK